MRRLLYVLLPLILLGCAQSPEESIDPRLMASETGVDITVLPNPTPTTITDKIVVYDSSAVEGSRIAGVNFSGDATDVLNGEGYFTSSPVEFGIAASDEYEDVATNAPAVTFRSITRFAITEIVAAVNVAPAGAAIIVDVLEDGVSIFSTKLQIDAGDTDSTTSLTPPVYSDISIVEGAKITVNIDQVGSTTAGVGLKLYFKGGRI